MFNTAHHHRHEVAPSYPQTVTKHEHRAPTDQSVELLREMERAAETKLLASLQCVDVECSFRAMLFDVPENPFERRLRIQMSLGGKKHDFTVEIPEALTRDKTSLVAEVQQAIANRIAKECLINLPSQVQVALFG